MQNLTIAQTLTMSSVEIAQLVGSRHGDVKRSIERLAASMVIQLPPMAKVENKQSNSPNRFSEAYIFEGEQGKRDSIIVVAQLCPEFTARLVDRWQELEKLAAQRALPENYISALEALLESKKSEAALALVNKKQEEEIHCLQNLFQVGMTPVQFCKQLNGTSLYTSLFVPERA
ncbi:Rha family transcriptional regulator [Symbiopectobacterium sp. Eva_TO]